MSPFHTNETQMRIENRTDSNDGFQMCEVLEVIVGLQSHPFESDLYLFNMKEWMELQKQISTTTSQKRLVL